MRKKTERFEMVMTPKEKKEIFRWARKVGISVAEYLLNCHRRFLEGRRAKK